MEEKVPAINRMSFMVVSMRTMRKGKITQPNQKPMSDFVHWDGSRDPEMGDLYPELNDYLMKRREIDPVVIMYPKDVKDRMDELAKKRIEQLHTVEHHFDFAFDRHRSFFSRVASFIRGETAAGRKTGIIVDILLLPFSRLWTTRELAKRVINRQRKQDVMKDWLKQKSTMEGIAAIAGAIGITLNPEALVEIITGVFVIWGGIELWRKDGEE